MEKLVEIGVPVYNEERHIEECLRSALDQTHRNLRVIVSDNNSEDNTARIVEDLSRADGRIQLFRQNSNKGPFENFEFCLDKAAGEYFLWLGGHDLFEAIQDKENLLFFEIIGE